MAGRFAGKPYAKAVEATPVNRSLIDALPRRCVETILPFLKSGMKEDDLQDYITLYYEEASRGHRSLTERVRKRIKSHIAEQKRENNRLYNPYRNISLDQCIGESKTPVSEWLDLSGWQEWSE